MRLLKALVERRMARRRGLWRLRVCVGALLTTWIVSRPTPLTSARWWRAPDVAAAIHLTDRQRDTIDRIYEHRLRDRRRCIERLVEASNQVDQLMRDGIFDDHALQGTQTALSAAADERMVRRTANDEILRVLSPEQIERLTSALPDHAVE